MLSPLFVSRGHVKPNFISDQNNAKIYRDSLGLCQLESDALSLLS